MINKFRVRLCLKDVYRYIVTGKTVSIMGIISWTATTKKIYVKYENYVTASYKASTEEERKEACKKINRYISEVR